MKRSLILTPLIAILVSLVGCSAQEERRNLKNSVTRLDQRLKNVDVYLKSLRDGQTELQTQKAAELKGKDREIQKLRSVIEQQDAAISKQRAALTREREKLQKAANESIQRMQQEMKKREALNKEEMNAQRRRMQAERAKIQSEIAKNQVDIEKLIAHERSEMTRRMADEKSRITQRIEMERKELRANIKAKEKDLMMRIEKEREEHQKMLRGFNEKIELLSLQVLAEGEERKDQNRIIEKLEFETEELNKQRNEATQEAEILRVKLERVHSEHDQLRLELAASQDEAASIASAHKDDYENAVKQIAKEREMIMVMHQQIQRDIDTVNAKAPQVSRLQAQNKKRAAMIKAMDSDTQKKRNAQKNAKKKQPAAKRRDPAKRQARNRDLPLRASQPKRSDRPQIEEHEEVIHEEGSPQGLNGIGTLIIHAESGTVNLHIQGGSAKNPMPARPQPGAKHSTAPKKQPANKKSAKKAPKKKAPKKKAPKKKRKKAVPEKKINEQPTPLAA